MVHTITGDLLRALEGPDNCVLPRLISVSSEGHCIICYERGQFCNFSINGKLLTQMDINDTTRVSDPEIFLLTEKRSLYGVKRDAFVLGCCLGHVAEQRWTDAGHGWR